MSTKTTITMDQNQDQSSESLNAYEARIQARKERYELRAEAARAESSTLSEHASKMASVIPFGQPIHVGHYSEGSDRRYRGKIHDTYGKSFAAQEKAEHYEQKASVVGTGGISSDDPNAIHKLKEQLTSAEVNQERMKAANKIIRKSMAFEMKIDELIAAGFSRDGAKEVLTPDSWGAVGFARFSLTNNNANITRIKKRIVELEKLAQRVDFEKAGKNFVYREDTTENRVMFVFEGKPEPEARTVLKQNGFKWSPTRSAWVRQLNNAGLWSAKRAFEVLNAM